MMTELPPDTVPLLLQGHVIDVLRTLPENSVQCVVCSPPYYGLRSYQTEPQTWRDGWRGELGQEPTPDLFTSHLADVFDEVHRVLRSDGVMWINIGDSYCGYKGDHVGDTEGNLEAHTPTSKSVGRITTGTPQTSGLKPKDMFGVPWMLAFELRRRGWWLRSDCIWAKMNGMPASVKDRPTTNHEYVFLFAKSGRYYYDQDAVRTPLPEVSVKRYQHAVQSHEQYDPSKHKHVDGVQTPMEVLTRAAANVLASGGANMRTVWWFSVGNNNDNHFASYPETLVELCVKAGTSEKGACAKCGTPFRRTTTSNLTGGWSPTCSCGTTETVPCIVLDPFSGSGTTCAVARSLGRRSIGVDLNASYIRMSEQRARIDVPDLQGRW